MSFDDGYYSDGSEGEERLRLEPRDYVPGPGSSFETASQRAAKPTASFGTTERFGPTGLEKGNDSPGVGRYRTAQAATALEGSSSPRRRVNRAPSSPSIGGGCGREIFKPADTPTEFNLSVQSGFRDSRKSRSSQGHTAAFGSSRRFGPTGLETHAQVEGPASPGPGAYSGTVVKTSPSRRSGPSTPRQRSAGRPLYPDLAEKAAVPAHEYSPPKSDFDIASERRSRSLSSTERFGPTGLEKFQGGPGPGAYSSPSSGIRPTSAGASPSRAHNDGRPLYSPSKTPGYDGHIGPIYAQPRSCFEIATETTNGVSSSFGTSERFGPSPLDKERHIPGPGTYSGSSIKERPASASRSTPSTPRSGRPIFNPPDAPTEFSLGQQSTLKSPRTARSSFGSTERFGPTGLEKFKGSPGPGAYTSSTSLMTSNWSPGRVPGGGLTSPGRMPGSVRSSRRRRTPSSAGSPSRSMFRSFDAESFSPNPRSASKLVARGSPRGAY